MAEDVAFGPGNLGLPPQLIRERVRDALRAVALERFRDGASYLLSPARKLRLVLAGALALEPACLLVDRATAQLDPADRKEAMALLRDLSRDRGIAVVHVTDDRDEAAGADRIVVCEAGEIVLDGSAARVLPSLEERAEMAPGPPISGAAVSGREPGERPSRFQEMAALHYLPGESILHRLDPRTKLALALVFLVSVALLHSFPALLLLLALTLLVACRAGGLSRRSLRGLKPILYLAVVAAAVNLVSIKGTPVVDHGWLRHISREALAVSAAMFLRVVLIAGAASLLTLSTTPFALAEGLERLLKPLKRLGVPVSEIAMMLLLALRFLPMIAQEAQSLARSRPAPGATGWSLMQRAGSYLPLLIPLFAGVARRGEALAAALEARGYRGAAQRTRMKPLVFSAADLACVAALSLVLFLAAGLEYHWTGRQPAPVSAYQAATGVK